MSDISNALSGYFFNIANAIREKTGRSDSIPLGNMATEIESISGGVANYDSFYVVCGDKRWLSGSTNKPTASDLITNVVIGNNVAYCSGLFDNVRFNQPVYVGRNVVNCSYMLQDTYFNQPINIPDSVVDCNALFQGDYVFNSPVNFGNNIVYFSGVFSLAENFNQPVNIPDSAITFNRTFSHAYKFNQPVTISDNAIDCQCMFWNARNFNQPINVPNNVTLCPSMFMQAVSFNQTVYIGTNVTNCASMFTNALNFNSPVIFNSLAMNVNLQRMFWNARKFNQPITIPNTVNPGSTSTDWGMCDQMFMDARSFNQDIVVPNGIYSCAFMFNNAISFGSNVYFKRTDYVEVKGMFRYTNNLLRKNLFFNSSLNWAINKTNTTDSIVLSSITWTDMSDGNGFYNAAYNIYCYNNYVV